MKNVIITGAKGNLGSAAVKVFLDKNYSVIACISQRDSPFDFRNENLDTYPLDLTDSGACESFIEIQIGKYNNLDAAVLTVGGFAIGNIDIVTKGDFEKQFALNFFTAFNMVQPLLKQMKNQADGGKIILIGSQPGEDGGHAKGSVAYGFSKSLVFRLAELINAEGKDKNISAHVIIPSTIDTPQNRIAMPNADFSKWNKAEDIADRIEKICAIEEIKSEDFIVRF